MPDRVAVARKLRFLMETQHLTVPGLAERLSIRRQSLQQIVDAKADPPRHTLVDLAKYFGVDNDYFDDVKAEKPAKADSSANTRGHARGRPSPAPARRTEAPEGLTLKTLAVRYQGLVELMIQKGVFSASEYHDHIKAVEDRAKKP